MTLAENDLYFTGGTVILDHGHGVSSAFLHMSKVHVQVGDVLDQGDLLGEIGLRGATGATVQSQPTRGGGVEKGTSGKLQTSVRFGHRLS